MAKFDLDPGFEEVKLDEGFQDIPVPHHAPAPAHSQSSPNEPSDLKDFGMGAEQGATLGLADEAGGGLQALLNKLQGTGHNVLPSVFSKSPTQQNAELEAQGFTGDIGPTDSSQMYRQAADEEAARFDQAGERSPWLYGSGQLAGGIGLGIATGGASSAAASGVRSGIGMGEQVALKEALKQGGKAALAKELGKRALTGAITAAPSGAVIGAGMSKGKLIDSTPEDKMQLAKDTGIGAAEGSALGGLFGLVGHGAKEQARSDSPLYNQLKASYKEGTEGRKFTGKAAMSERLAEQQGASSDVTDQLFNARKQLGENIEDVLSSAGQSGIKVTPSENLLNNSKDLSSVLFENPRLLGTDKSKKYLELLNKLDQGELDPAAANQVRREIKETLLGVDDPEIKNVLTRFSQSLDGDIAEAVPGFKDANKQFHDFNRASLETITNKGIPQEFNQTYLSNVNKPKEKVFQASQKILKEMNVPGTGAEQSTQTFNSFIANLKKLDQEQPGLLKKLNINPAELENKMQKQADLGAIRQSITGYEPQSGLKSQVLGTFTARGSLMANANRAGRVVGLGKSLYKATDDQLRAMTPELSNIPGMKHIAGSLEDALTKNDMQKKNAVLFSIMQNPAAREFINSQFGEDQGEDQQ